MENRNLYEQPNSPHQDARVGLWLGLSFVLSALLFAGGAWYLLKANAPPKSNADCQSEPQAEECLRRMVVSYLAQPGFSGLELERQVIGETHLELYAVDKQELYLSLPASVPQAEELDRRLQDPSAITAAKEVNGRWRLGDYSLAKTAEKGFFFKTAVGNLKINPDQVLEFSLEQAKYRISLRELADFYSNRATHNGLLRADTGTVKDGKGLIFFNHGAFVAKAGEPSLKRLADELTKDIAPDDPLAREKRIQKILDVVGEDIAYDFVEATLTHETLKRPNETLMTRQSDCSNKAILLASLLEQLGEDYLLLYVPEHITVAVRQGGFPNKNGLVFRFEGTDWAIAESTARGFQVGVTRVENAERLLSVNYVQRPKIKNLIFNLKNMQPLEFR